MPPVIIIIVIIIFTKNKCKILQDYKSTCKQQQQQQQAAGCEVIDQLVPPLLSQPSLHQHPTENIHIIIMFICYKGGRYALKT